MIAVATPIWVQAADAAGRLEWIAWAETLTAAGTVILALIGIGLAIMGFSLLRAALRLLRALERTVDRLAPRTEPLIDRAARIADDAAEVSGRIRRSAEELDATVDGLNRQLRAAADAAEDRVRRFGTVLDTVRTEVEEVLLDAAASARGLHAAAESLREPRRVVKRERAAPADDD